MKNKTIKQLKKENEEIRNLLDNCFPIDTAENEDTWKKIGFLIENEIKQERMCGE